MNTISTLEDQIRDIAAQEARKNQARPSATEEQSIQPEFLRKSEACAYLGGISLPTLDKLVKQGKIQAYRPTPDRVVFYREELKQYLLSSKKPS